MAEDANVNKSNVSLPNLCELELSARSRNSHNSYNLLEKDKDGEESFVINLHCNIEYNEINEISKGKNKHTHVEVIHDQVITNIIEHKVTKGPKGENEEIKDYGELYPVIKKCIDNDNRQLEKEFVQIVTGIFQLHLLWLKYFKLSSSYLSQKFAMFYEEIFSSISPNFLFKIINTHFFIMNKEKADCFQELLETLIVYVLKNENLALDAFRFISYFLNSIPFEKNETKKEYIFSFIRSYNIINDVHDSNINQKFTFLSDLGVFSTEKTYT